MTKPKQTHQSNGDQPVEINLALTGDPIQKLEQGKKAAAALMTVNSELISRSKF